MPVLQHSSGRWTASIPTADGNGAELRQKSCSWTSDEEVVALELDDRSDQAEVGPWRDVLHAMEVEGIVDCEIKGHALRRVLPGAGAEGVGSWEIGLKTGVVLNYRWPVFSGGV